MMDWHEITETADYRFKVLAEYEKIQRKESSLSKAERDIITTAVHRLVNEDCYPWIKLACNRELFDVMTKIKER